MKVSAAFTRLVITYMSALALASGGCSSDGESADDDASSGGSGGTNAGGAGARGGSSGATSAGTNASGGSTGSSGKAGVGGATSGGAGGAVGGATTAGVGAGGAAGSAGTEAGQAGTAASGEGGASGSLAGSAGKGGAAGSGGSGKGDPFTGDCPTALVGWATVSGDGVSNTTGGGNAAPVRPTSADQLMQYASDSTPRVIEISGTFNVPELEVASNKTLIGVGDDAVINGGIRVRGYDDAMISNVILKNFGVNGGATGGEDAVQIYFAHHVWIDHMDIWDGPDGNLDLTHAVNWVTVSWTKFRYTTAYQRPDGESSDHRFSSLVGHSDNNEGEDNGRLKVSFHHNWWAEGVIERMPRVRFGQVHVFNNYYSSAGNNYCIRAGRGAQLLVEGNYFDAVNNPHEFNNEDDEPTASITSRDNVYAETTGVQLTGGGGPTFTNAPYEASIEAASDVPSVVQACAGPR